VPRGLVGASVSSVATGTIPADGGELPPGVGKYAGGYRRGDGSLILMRPEKPGETWSYRPMLYVGGGRFEPRGKFDSLEAACEALGPALDREAIMAAIR